MKLLTLNTHSLQEKNYLEKLKQFIQVILIEKPDIIAMQEVNQTANSKLATKDLLSGFITCSNEKISIREDNYAAQVSKYLHESGISCSWTWISSKIGYSKYDEGLSLISLNQKITNVDSFYISKIHDYQNWKTRKVLGIQTSYSKDWFFTVHMGWWQDEEEPFADQWNLLNFNLQEKINDGSNIWIMGDFNSPAEIRDQGYDCVQKSGWFDTYSLAAEKDDGLTVKGQIDGWKTSHEKEQFIQGMRIDHIWCSNLIKIKSSKVVFNGINHPVVSDHFGVLVSI